MLRAATVSILCALALPGTAASSQAPPARARVLAFLASPSAQDAADPAVVLPFDALSVVEGDVLAYRLRWTGSAVGPRGLEIVDATGRRTLAPDARTSSAWTDVRVPLRAGSTVTRLEAVARRVRGEQVAYELDDVRIERADGTTLDVFRDEFAGSVQRIAGVTNSAGIAVVDLGDELFEHHVHTHADVSDPWGALDLTALRALDRQANPPGPRGLPRGLAWTGPCIPLRFATEGGDISFTAHGQHIGLDPVDGGRFYEVWLAVLNTSAEEIDTRLVFVGVDRERVEVPLRVPARGPDGYSPATGQGHPARDYALLETRVASTASLASFQLPDDPRLAVLAITVSWRRDGASDARFRENWLANAALSSRPGLEETDRADLRRYLSNRRAGASFGGVDGEEEADRALFDALLAQDTAAFRGAIAQRLAAQTEAARGRKSARIDLVATLPRADDDLAASLADGLLPTDLPVVGGDVRAIASLAVRDPAAFERLRERMKSGTWLAIGVGLESDVSARLGADALIRAITDDQLELERLTGTFGSVARIDADLARVQNLPQILTAVGIRAALLDGLPKPLATPVARFASRGVELLAFSPSMRSEGPLRFDAATWRPWTKAATSPSGRPPIPVFCDVSSTVAGETLSIVADLDASDMAPDLAWSSVVDVVEAGKARAEVLEFGMPMTLEPGDVRAELDARSAIRLAEREVARASVVEALAALDGAPNPGADTARTWREIIAAARSNAADATRLARAIAERAKAAAADRLAHLRAAVPPPGDGVPLAILDPLPWSRASQFELANAELRCAGTDGDLPMQRTASGGMLVEYAGRGSVPSALRVRRDPLAEPRAPARVRLEGWTVRTDDLVVAIDPTTGRITRISAFGAGEETALLAGDGDSLTWIGADGTSEPIDGLESIEYVERGPLRAIVRIVRKSARARVETELRVTAGSSGLELRSRVDLVDASGDVVHTFPMAHATANALVSIPLGSSPIAPSAGLRALDGWAAATDGAATFALIGEGATAFRWKDRAFGVVLAETGAKTARNSSIRILGRVGGWRPAGLDAVLLEHVMQPIRVAFDAPERGLASREAIVRVARIERDGRRTLGAASGLVPLSIEAGPDGSIDVRVLETRGEAGHAEISFAREPFDAVRVDVLGRDVGSLTVTGRAVDVAIGVGKVESVRARLSP